MCVSSKERVITYDHAQLFDNHALKLVSSFFAEASV